LPPEGMQAGVATYAAANNPHFEITKLTHFALGIFWKASVHSWEKRKQIEPRIDLGPYGERLRKFLRGESSFPNNMALTIWLADRNDVSNFTGGAQPYRGRCKDAHSYSFCV